MHARILIADPLDPSGLEILRSLRRRDPPAHHRRTPASQGAHRGLRRPGRPQHDQGNCRAVARRQEAEGRRTGRHRRRQRRRRGGDRAGILVVNAPTANLMSATEHTFALLLAVARKVPGRRCLDEGRRLGPQELPRRRAAGQDARDRRLRPHRPAGGGARPRLRDGGRGLRPVPRRAGGAQAGRRAAADRRAPRPGRRRHPAHAAHRADAELAHAERIAG